MSWELDCEHPFRGDLVVRRYTWENGLRALLLSDRTAPVFSYQTWFSVGSRHERPGATGMAHLFEHLMFNSTRSLPPGEFDRLIETAGGDTNAATWVDWTFYRDSLPARDLELAIRLESDRMQNLVLEDEQLESEREVVANERMLRVEDDVDGFIDEQLFKLAFTTHPYHWPTIGWMDDIRSLSKPDVHAFYRAYYAPNNATIVLVGDFEETRALDLIQRYYGAIPSAELPTDLSRPEPEQTEERRAQFVKPVPADRLVVGYKSPSHSHPDWIVLDVIGQLLAGGPSARLHHRLIVDREIATTVDYSLTPFAHPGLFSLAINMIRGHAAGAAEAEIDAAIARLRDERVDARELDKVKNGMETDFWSELVSCDGKAEALGHYQTTLGDFRKLFEKADAVRAVTAADVTRVARAYLSSSQRTVVVARPGAEERSE